MSDNKNNVNDAQECRNDSCCSSGGGISRSMKTGIFIGVLVLAGAVAAHSLMNKGSNDAPVSNEGRGRGATCCPSAVPAPKAPAACDSSAKGGCSSAVPVQVKHAASGPAEGRCPASKPAAEETAPCCPGSKPASEVK